MVKRVRSLQLESSYLYTIMLTARDEPTVLNAAYAAGIDDFARRPIRREELARARRRRRAIATPPGADAARDHPGGARHGPARRTVAGLDEQNEMVPAPLLREGMVVVRSVLNPKGGMLVPAGTRITSRMAARVAHAIGASVLVEVSSEAA